MIGLPSKVSRYVHLGMWYLLALIALLPVLLMLIARLRKGSRSYRPRFGLGTRILSILLAFLFIITPSILQQVVQASSQYSQVSTTDWATHTYIEYTYDDNGSCISKTTKNSSNAEVESVAYEYNLQNRLFRVTTDPISDNTVYVTEYTYNIAGNRVQSYSYDMPRDGGPHSNEVTTSYLIDAYNHTGYAQVLEEYDGTNSITYTIGDDIVSQSRYNGSTATVRHYLYDGQGSTRQLTDNSGALATDQSFSYDGYGVMVGYSGTPQTNLLYTGEYYDSNLKQYNLRARYYNPSNGRFNRMDDYSGNMQDPQSLHKYLYAHANPCNYIDPSGMFTLLGFNVTNFIRNHLMLIILGTVLAALASVKLYIECGMKKNIFKEPYIGYIKDSARRNRLKPTLVAAIISAEISDLNGWDLDDVSGAKRGKDRSIGIGQIKVSTALKYNLVDTQNRKEIIKRLQDPKMNIEAVARYLRIVADLAPQPISLNIGFLDVDYQLDGDQWDYSNDWTIYYIASEYTSLPWDGRYVDWGYTVTEHYRKIEKKHMF